MGDTDRSESAPLPNPAAHLHQLLDCLDAIVWQADADLRHCSFVSRRAALLLGYPCEQWLSEPHFWSSHLHPDDQARVQALCDAALRSGQPQVGEHRMLAADGRSRWFRTALTCVADAGGHPQLHGVMIDLTEHKLAEAALSESEARFQRLADSVPLLIWMRGREGECRFVNRRWLQFTGRTLEQSLGTGWLASIHPDDRERWSAAYHAACAARTSWTLEYRLLRVGGSYHWVLDTGVPRFTSDGVLIGYVGAALDINERKLAEAALQASELRGRLLAAHSPDLIARLTPAGRYVDVSPACQALLGYLPSELTGRAIEELSHPDDLPALRELLAVTPIPDQPITRAHRMRTRDGHYRWFETTVSAVGSDRLPLEIVAISHDSTARRQAEAERAELFAREQLARTEAEVLRKTDRLKSEFIASVSHELRTPLHHIKGYATTLLRPLLHFDAQTTREYLQIIVEESDKLQRLISDLLDTSRIETGALTLEIESTQLDDLIRHAVERWQGCDEHQFELLVPAEVPPIPADPQRIQQVLDNLLGNVVRHTPPHTTATITVQVTRDEQIVMVADQGPGIGGEHLAHIFERFYQASAAARRGGSGLGLFISKGIIEQHGGSIAVELADGGGTLFRFRLPRRRVHSRTAVGLHPASLRDAPQ